MYIDGVTEFYRNREIEDKLNDKLSSCKTQEERKEFFNSLRPKLDLVGRLISQKRPDWISHILVSN